MWLYEKHPKLIILIKLPSDEGKAPLNVFGAKDKKVRLVHNPISDGIVVNLFE